jgi:hypothetical protein
VRTHLSPGCAHCEKRQPHIAPNPLPARLPIHDSRQPSADHVVVVVPFQDAALR